MYRRGTTPNERAKNYPNESRAADHLEHGTALDHERSWQVARIRYHSRGVTRRNLTRKPIVCSLAKFEEENRRNGKQPDDDEESSKPFDTVRRGKQSGRQNHASATSPAAHIVS